MPAGTEELYEEAAQSLKRMQEFDLDSLAREEELGRDLNFHNAREPASLLVSLYNRLSPTALEDFPDPLLKSVRDQANSHYQLFTQVLEFTPQQQNPVAVRDGIINSIEQAYTPAFSALHPLIAYSLHRAADFQRLDAQARAVLQNVEDKAANFETKMSAHEEEAQAVLEQIRNVAAEEGVTQQAVYFRREAEEHEKSAETWRGTTIKLAYLLGGFAVISLFLHRIPVLAPENTYDAVQLAISKILIFAVIAYMLFLSARNFLNHKHNSIVNKHRQNALMTHKALVEAALEPGVRQAIMIQAASCIFSPQGTGYASMAAEHEMSSQRSLIEILSKPMSHSGE